MTEQNSGLPKWFIIPIWAFRLYGVFNIAFFVLPLLIFLMAFYQGTTGVLLNRLGLVMQIAGLGSLIPAIISTSRLQRWEEKFTDLGAQLGEEVLYIFRFYYAPFNKAVRYEKDGKKIIDRIYRFSRGYIYLAVLSLIPLELYNSLQPSSYRVSVVAAVFAYILLGVIMRWVTRRAKKGNMLLAILRIAFFPLYLLVDGWSLVISVGIASMFLVVIEIIRRQTRTTLVQTLNRWTVPVIALGMVLEYISTYLK